LANAPKDILSHGLLRPYHGVHQLEVRRQVGLGEARRGPAEVLGVTAHIEIESNV
jgi:hypothetical protein